MPRVLVIDDQPYVRATIAVTLKANGFDVVAAESGRMGLNKVENSHFDLVIVDIYMPEMDGVALIKALRQHDPRLPIIAMSGVMFRSTGRTVLDILPMAPDLSDIVCLQKPFRPNELLQAAQNAMAVVAAQ
jgi:CheY-like chemotaxis protein